MSLNCQLLYFIPRNLTKISNRFVKNSLFYLQRVQSVIFVSNSVGNGTHQKLNNFFYINTFYKTKGCRKEIGLLPLYRCSSIRFQESSSFSTLTFTTVISFCRHHYITPSLSILNDFLTFCHELCTKFSSENFDKASNIDCKSPPQALKFFLLPNTIVYT